MGELTNILKGIPIPASAIKKLVEKETEIASLKTEIKNLKAKLQRIESDKTIQDYICDYCHQLTGELIKEEDAYPLNQFNQIKRSFKCKNCGQEYKKQYERR